MEYLANLQQLVGTWRHPSDWDSEDWLAEYTISVVEGRPVISARDINDGEEFTISDVVWDGTVLRFRSLFPSTGREGLNEFTLLPTGGLRSRFTFTVVEEFRRVEA